jgi:hypothetical protein
VGGRRAHHPAALELGLVHVNELVLVEDGVDQEVGEGNGGHHGLDDAEHQAQQDGDAAVWHLQFAGRILGPPFSQGTGMADLYVYLGGLQLSRIGDHSRNEK